MQIEILRNTLVTVNARQVLNVAKAMIIVLNKKIMYNFLKYFNLCD